jgi:N-acetylmuramoyl-L-alanine amidase CwlA
MVEIKKNLTTINYTSGSGTSRIKYIVVHYTASPGDTALGETQYFKSVNRNASAHYFVDDTSIYQCVEDKDISWHCGGGRQSSMGGAYYGLCKNSNSIGIEMCCKKRSTATKLATDTDWYITDATLKNTKELVEYLMQKYNIPKENVIRHYDVTGKYCPNPMMINNEASDQWAKFKDSLGKEEIKMFADVKKDDYAYEHIEKLLRAGIVQGDENGNFNPDEPITRRDMAVMISRTLTFLGQ